jgi:hypothetical protein
VSLHIAPERGLPRRTVSASPRRDGTISIAREVLAKIHPLQQPRESQP